MAGRLHGVVAMDGPSGTGKSTVSRRLAQAVGAAYLDTGAMYRAVTLAVLRAGLEPDEPGRRGGRRSPRPRPCGRSPTRRRRSSLLDGEDVEAEIRGPGDARGQRGVREAAGAGRAGGAASAELIAEDRGRHRRRGPRHRQRRRSRTPRSRSTSPRPRRSAPRGGRRRTARPGATADHATVLADVRRRDRLDSTRKTSPLHAAADALVLDTDDLPRRRRPRPSSCAWWRSEACLR